LGVEVVLDCPFLYEVDNCGRFLVAAEQHERVCQEWSEGGVVAVVANLQKGFGDWADDLLGRYWIPGEKLVFGRFELDAREGHLETELLG
jgi:hypothetical protein